MSSSLLLSPKQLEYITHANAKWNISHGAVRSGKTVGSLFAFMADVERCPDSQIWMLGHTSSTIYDNAIRLILEPKPKGIADPLAIFRPFCTWKKGDRELLFKDKTISTVGAKDAGAVGAITGKTMSLVYCDEMVLYPDNIIEMLDTRLSNPWSKGHATMNPSYPTHILKGWIDKAVNGNPDYYALHWMLDDNPYLDENYKNRIRNSLSGVFYKRNYLGLWCLAEGAIFDFFDRAVHVKSRPDRSADYWIAAIDDGNANNFACVLLGVSTGKNIQSNPQMWVQDEFVWDIKDRGRRLTMAEKIESIQKFTQDYYVKNLYVDPAAAALKTEFRKVGIAIQDADNDVRNGIEKMTSWVQQGQLYLLSNCKRTIKEIESYVWDPKASEKGEDRPCKKDDHCVDALRYAVYTHKIATFDYEEHNKRQREYMQNRFDIKKSIF